MRRHPPLAILVFAAAAAVPPADASSFAPARRRGNAVAFQHPSLAPRSTHRQTIHRTARCNSRNNDDASQPSFLSTTKASVNFKSTTSSGGSNGPSNLSAIDQLLVALTSDRTSLLLGSIGILLLLVNRLISFPDEAVYEASRSRIDLLGVFAAGSVLLNGITKLDVESVQAERVALEGVNVETVAWNEGSGMGRSDTFQSTVEWALASFLKCSPARTAVLLATCPIEGREWTPLASLGILPPDPQLRTSLPVGNTPILDRMLRDDDNIKGGTVGGTEVAGAANRKGPKESYLPTLQALPGRVEFSYLPGNAQEALLLPVPKPKGSDDGWYYAVVLGGDTAKSFAPRDIAWCKEIASWIGEVV